MAATAWAEVQERWPEDTARRPSANTQGPAAGWYERLGMLADPPGDRWWTLRTQEDVTVVAEEVVGLLRDQAVPELRRQLTRDPRRRASEP